MKQNITEIQNYIASLFSDADPSLRISEEQTVELSGISVSTPVNKKLLISKIEMTDFYGNLDTSDEGRVVQREDALEESKLTRTDELECIMIGDSIDGGGANGSVKLTFRVYTLQS